MLACLDELPSTAPLPTLRTRMANERALGVSFIYAAQTWRQLAAVFGEQQARALFGLTNVLVMFGGSKDGAFNQEISDLVGQTRVSRSNWQTGAMAGRTFSGGGHCDHPPRRDPPAAGTTRVGDRRERQTDHRPAVPLHRRT
jgi:type IV secretion system protein VirD4